MEKLKPLLDFIKTHAVKILIGLLVITYIGSCNKGKNVRKLEKQNKELGTKSDDLLAALDTGENNLDDINAWGND